MINYSVGKCEDALKTDEEASLKKINSRIKQRLQSQSLIR